MTESHEPTEPQDDEERHPLESEDALREPRDLDEDDEAERAPQPGLTPAPPNDD